jgi:hypothetical protein
LGFETLDQGRDVGLQIGLVDLGREAIHATGRLFIQVVPAVQEQGGIQTSVQIPKPVLLVGLRFVGYPPQGGWLLVVRSDCVRQELPVRAPYFRHVLPLVRGFPTR